MLNRASGLERQGKYSLTREQMAELPREGGAPVAFLWLGIALVIMPMATRCNDNATVLANYFAMSEFQRRSDNTPSAPVCQELATAIAGARKSEENDIAVGNLLAPIF